MAVFNEPTKWQTSLVNSGDANTIPQNTPVGTGEASFEEGFPQITQIPLSAGGQAPDRKDFNGLFKVLGDWIFFNQNGGVSTYSENFDYVAGRVVLYNDNIYKCIQANGVSSTVVTPDSDTAYWQRLDNYDLIPCGSYIQHAGDSAPSGFLVCNGGAVSRTTYAKLFSVIGTKYGAGDGSTTFNLPNLMGRFLEGGTASGTVYEAGLPNITGSFGRIQEQDEDIRSGAFYTIVHKSGTLGTTATTGIYDIGFEASRSNSIYGNSATVQPNAVTCLICIKY